MLRALNNHFLLLDTQARLVALLKKKIKFSSKSNPGERHWQRRKFTSGLYHEFSLVAFENFEWLLMIPAVICNNCNFTKQYWSNILGNEFLGGNILGGDILLFLAEFTFFFFHVFNCIVLCQKYIFTYYLLLIICMLPAILSHVKCQWNIFYKLKQGNFQKSDVGAESQDICQELSATSGHTKSIFSMILGRFLKTWRYNRPVYVIIAINLYSGGFTTTTFCFKRYSPSQIWKKPNDITCFFTFFHNIGHNLTQILPQDHINLIFFADFQWSVLNNSINIKNFNYNPVVLKKNC